MRDRARDDASGLVGRLVWAGGNMVLREGQHIIGRNPDAAVFLDSPSASRRLARIRVADRRVTFEDLDSKNGSSIGGRRTAGPVPLGTVA